MGLPKWWPCGQKLHSAKAVEEQLKLFIDLSVACLVMKILYQWSLLRLADFSSGFRAFFLLAAGVHAVLCVNTWAETDRRRGSFITALIVGIIDFASLYNLCVLACAVVYLIFNNATSEATLRKEEEAV
jgi:hypothetical protein